MHRYHTPHTTRLTVLVLEGSTGKTRCQCMYVVHQCRTSLFIYFFGYLLQVRSNVCTYRYIHTYIQVHTYRYILEYNILHTCTQERLYFYIFIHNVKSIKNITFLVTCGVHSYTGTCFNSTCRGPHQEAFWGKKINIS